MASRIPTLALLLISGFLYASTAEEQAAESKMQAVADRLIAALASKANGHPQHVGFQFTDRECNAFVRALFEDTPHPGVDKVTLKFFPNNYVSTFMIIDFDAIEETQPGTIPTILTPILSGKSGILIDARMQAHDGGLTFKIEKASFNNLRLPAWAVQQVIATLAAQQPDHFDLTRPIPLPNGVQRLWTRLGVMEGEN